MEAIGLAASLATLLEIALGALELSCHFRDAPSEIERVASHLQLLSMEVHFLTNFFSKADDNLLPKPMFITLERSIKSAKATISSTNTAVLESLSHHGFATRLQWTLIEKSKVKSLMEDLGSLESTLMVILNILQCRHEEQAQNSLKVLDANVALLLRDVAFVKDRLEYRPVKELPSSKPLKKIPGAGFPMSNKISPRYTASKHLTTNAIIPALEIIGALTTNKTATKSEYYLSLLCRLPFSLAIALDLKIRIAVSGWPRLSFPIISPKHSVPPDSPFMIACSRGDVVAMRQLMYFDKIAGPNDITEGNVTPMCLAIQSGNVNAVDMLIQGGADVNESFGRYQTSPLAWALKFRHTEVARLLLVYGACLQHISAWGWSPIYYLWEDSQTRLPSSVDIINLLWPLPGFQFSYQGLTDINGWSVLNRAVLFGTADEISLLLKIGTDQYSKVGPLEWTPIHNAAFYGQYEIFRILLPYYRHLHIDRPDPRGWTLLHIAASAGHANIVKHLLQEGADWQAKSRPSWSHMPEVLHGKSCTPAEVARAQNKEREELFLETVRELGGKVVSLNTEYEGDEMWYDAAEVAERQSP